MLAEIVKDLSHHRCGYECEWVLGVEGAVEERGRVGALKNKANKQFKA